MSKIYVDDQKDLEDKFIKLVGLTMTHIKWHKIYAEQFGAIPKRLKKESLEKMEEFIRELCIVKKDNTAKREQVTNVIKLDDV